MDQHLTKEQLEQSVEYLRREIASLRFLERSHKEDQKELRAIELQLSGIIHSAMDAIITVDESQHVILFNFTAEQMFQCSGQDAMGRSIDQFIPERFRENHKNHIKVFGKTKTTNRKMGALGSITGVRADGEEFPLEASISQAEVNGRKLFTVILRDISERSRFEQTLKASEERFKTFMNNCPALAWMKDAEGRYVYINRTFEEVQAMTPSDCLGKTDFDLWPTEVAEQLRKNDLEVLAKGHPVESQEQVPTLERGVKNLLVLKFPVVRDGGIRFIGGFAVDVTHRKELEEQLRKTEQLAELGTLASGMAHEIGTPMNVILGRAEFLMRKTADDSTRKGLETIVTQVERITKIMNQLLSFARKRPLQRRPIDLSVTIKDILDVVQELLKKNKIQMDIDFDNNKRKVFADPDKMSQVLLNLVFNAVHAMSNGGTLRIGLQDSGNQIQLTVADTGCGIPQSYLSKVFDPFFTTKDIGEGTGLGLTVVHGIIQEHKGSISVKSEPEKGTKFVISLPIHESGV